MGGSPSYEAARPDPTQQALNTHTLERLKHDEVLLDAKRKTDDERAAAVKAGGQASYKSFVTNLENQYDTGLISADQVETKWKDYKGAYTLGAEYGLDDYTRFQTTASTKETGNREYKAGRLFEDLLNRKADTRVFLFRILRIALNLKMNTKINSLLQRNPKLACDMEINCEMILVKKQVNIPTHLTLLLVPRRQKVWHLQPV